ncbi:colicin E3/pyocin S6 family cytotoxin [Saccharothrix australiensis]|uniref:colicin E3/pyocin S6 family cytotoxin n=1 Tax=Saccharothrix australiensis TaxID=2072 RepID=UPI003CCC8DE3
MKGKTAVRGGGGLRARWEDRKFIYEWDSRHGEIEKYDKRGKRLGSFDHSTGDPIPIARGGLRDLFQGGSVGDELGAHGI